MASSDTAGAIWREIDKRIRNAITESLHRWFPQYYGGKLEGSAVWTATSSTLGVVEPDNTTTWVDDLGIIHAGTATTTTVVATTGGATRALSLAQAPANPVVNDPPPVDGSGKHFYEVGYSETATAHGNTWGNAVVGGGETAGLLPIPATGSHIDNWATTGAGPNEGVCFRQSFTLPNYPIASATLEICPDSIGVGVWINGHALGAFSAQGNWSGSHPAAPFQTFAVPVEWLVQNSSSNLIACQVTNETGVSADNDAGVTYLLTITSVRETVVVAHNGSVVGTRPEINIIDGSNVTLTVADNASTDAVDITIAASGGGGGGFLAATSYGTTSQGGSSEAIAGNTKCFLKKITPSTDGLIPAVQAWVKADNSHLGNLCAVIYADNAGVPGKLIGAGTMAALQAYFLNATYRQMTLPLGYWATASTAIWIGVGIYSNVSNTMSIAFATSGSDYTVQNTGGWITDGSIVTPASTSNNYSISCYLLH